MEGLHDAGQTAANGKAARLCGRFQTEQPDLWAVRAHLPHEIFVLSHHDGSEIENSKAGRGFTVPLAPAVVGWFAGLEPFACGSRFVLPARQHPRRWVSGGHDMPFEQRALNAMLLHKLCTKLGDKVRRFTPHDLRSTARSRLAALGVSVMVAERCLNHTLGGLIAIYDQHDYLTERRAALELWASFILACETGRAWIAPAADNVVPMRRTAAGRP